MTAGGNWWRANEIVSAILPAEPQCGTIHVTKPQLLSPREYDCELVKMDEEWLFISRAVLRMDRKFSIP
jgi:hypothetical protein